MISEIDVFPKVKRDFCLAAALWHIAREDMKLVREDILIRENMKRQDEEFSKRDTLCRAS